MNHFEWYANEKLIGNINGRKKIRGAYFEDKKEQPRILIEITSSKW